MITRAYSECVEKGIRRNITESSLSLSAQIYLLKTLPTAAEALLHMWLYGYDELGL